MGKTSWSYFLTAVLLIGSVKLIEVLFYDQLKPSHPEAKVYKGEVEAEKVNEEVPEEVDFSKGAETDSSSFEQKETVQENPDNLDSGTEANSSNDESLPEENSLTGRAYFQDLKNSYLSPILANLPEGRSREDIVVRYYKHNMDRDKVYALRTLGYYLHEKEAEDNKDLESNVLYYGYDVDQRDIQLVAFTLLESGVPLRSIQQSQFDWKSNSLEIGADSLLQNNPLLKISDVEAFYR